MSIKRITSFTHLITGEGDRISFTYSEMDENGTLIKQNNRGNFVVVDEGILNHINAINDYITRKILIKEE